MTPGVGPRAATKLLERFGSADAVFHGRRLELESLRMRPETIESIIKREFFERAETELDRVKKIGGDVLILDDGSYPSLLREIDDPPPVLYVKGRLAGVCRAAGCGCDRVPDVFDLWRKCFGDVVAGSCIARHYDYFGPCARNRQCGASRGYKWQGSNYSCHGNGHRRRLS